MKYIILGIIALFFLILFYQNYNIEGFDYNPPDEVSLPVRSDDTCGDSDLNNMFDRFHYVTAYDKDIYEDSGCPKDYVRYNFFGNSNVCLPNCPSNYSPYPYNDTYCIANKCYIGEDLSGNIQDSWNEVCGVLYKTNQTLRSTVTSISSVVNTINIQFKTVNSNFTPFSNSLYHTSITDSGKLQVRDLNFPNILSNYNDMYSYQNIIQSNYINLKNGMIPFNTLYGQLNCSNYQ